MTTPTPWRSGPLPLLAAAILGTGAALTLLRLVGYPLAPLVVAVLVVGVPLVVAPGVRRLLHQNHAVWRPAAGPPAPRVDRRPPQGDALSPPRPEPSNGAAPRPDLAGDDAEPVPVAIAVPGGAWWQAAGDRRQAAPHAAPPRRAAPSLSSYAPATRLVQCPGCGGFRVALELRPPRFHFGCLGCGHRWTWRRGDPWPKTTLQPGHNDHAGR